MKASKVISGCEIHVSGVYLSTTKVRELITVFSIYLLSYNICSRMLILFPCCYVACLVSEGMNTLPQQSLFRQPSSAEAGLKEATAQHLQPVSAVLVLLLSGDVAAPGRPPLPPSVRRWWVHLKKANHSAHFISSS